jgi:hypothetical protein
VTTRARNLPLTGALPQYAEALTRSLDEALGDARRNSDSPTLSAYYEGQAGAYRLALSYLHIWTGGRYGTALESTRTDTTEEVR